MASYELKLKNTSTEAAANITVGSVEIAEAYKSTAISNAVRVAVKNNKTGDVYYFNPSANETYVSVLGADGTVADSAEGPLQGEYKGGKTGDFNTAAVGKAPVYTADDTVIATIPAFDPAATATDDLFPYENVFTVYVWFEGQSASCVTSSAGLASSVEITFAIAD